MIRGVMFDLDGTLFDRDRAIAALAKSQYSRFREPLAGVPESDFVVRLIELDDHGHADKTLVYDSISAEFSLSRDLARRLELDFWSRYHDECVALPNTHSVLRALRSRGVRLALVTNGRSETQNRTVDALGIRILIDEFLVSETENVREPDLEIFQLAASRLGLPPGDCAFVGDHPISDIQGATRAGMMPIWKRVPYWEAPDSCAAISDLTELEAVLFPRKPPAA